MLRFRQNSFVDPGHPSPRSADNLRRNSHRFAKVNSVGQLRLFFRQTSIAPLAGTRKPWDLPPFK